MFGNGFGNGRISPKNKIALGELPNLRAVKALIFGTLRALQVTMRVLQTLQVRIVGLDNK